MDIRELMQANNLEYLLVNTTNEFLVEYNTLEENTLYKLTGFSGSTGNALVTFDKIYLFVDGRYHIQADLEVNHSKVTVIKISSQSKFMEELLKILPPNSQIGVFAKKHSVNSINNLAKNYKIKLIKDDPFDTKTKSFDKDNISLDKNLCGLSTEEKVAEIIETIDLQDDEIFYVTNLDDISYLFNMRNYSMPYSAKIKGKGLVTKNNTKLYTPDMFDELEEFLKNTKSTIIIDNASINCYDLMLLEDAGVKILDIEKNPIQYMKSVKTKEELESLKDAFRKTDNAIGAVRDYIYNNDNICENDIEQKLREEFKKQGAVGLSFKPIIAKDKNSALAHYSKSSKDEIIKDGSLVLIDCGAYFDGGLATDITRVFVKGEPTELHKKIYTYVLKAFLNAFNYFKTHKSCHCKEEHHRHHHITGFEIDSFTREFFANLELDGFVFNHGLGHGIGINVHEYPPSLSNGEMAKVPILEGECFSIEPGLYKEGVFGIRLENSCYFENGDIHSFVHMNYENKLINYDMLNEQEKKWLKEFEVK